MPTEPFFETLGFTPANPPNAALVAEFRTGQGVVLLELTEPILDAGTGTVVYGAEILQGYQGKTLVPVLSEDVAARLPAEFGPAALFIDSGAEAMVWATAAVSGAGLGITYTSYPPTQLEVCGFSAIPGAIGGNPDIGEYTGIASLYLGSAQFSQGVWITADCVTISPPPGVNAFSAGQYRLEITAPPDYRLIDFANFRL
jgi:hypothetical protein